MLDEQFASILAIQGLEDLQRESVSFARWLGFDTVCAMGVTDKIGEESLFRSVDNVPQSYRRILESVPGGRTDPVMQHCKHRGTPMIWGRETYLAAGRMDYWEEQAPFGLKSGIALALHLPHGRHFFVGVGRDGNLPAEGSSSTREAAYLHLFASLAHEVAIEALLGTASGAPASNLSCRELECLRWTIDGKTAWEVGYILESASRRLRDTSAMPRASWTARISIMRS